MVNDVQVLCSNGMTSDRDEDAVHLALSEHYLRAMTRRPTTLAEAVRRIIVAQPPKEFDALRIMRVYRLKETDIARIDLTTPNRPVTFANGAGPGDVVADWHSAGFMPEEHPGSMEIYLVIANSARPPERRPSGTAPVIA